MNDRKRITICICISVFLLFAIVAAHFGFDHYLKTARLIDMKFAYYTVVVLPEPMPIEEAKEKYPDAFEPVGFNSGKGLLKETDAQKVMIAADIVSVGTSIFIILFYLSFTASHPHRRKVLSGLFIVFIAGAVVTFFLMYMHFSDVTYTVTDGGPEIIYASLGEPL